jgi:hypothetical protein
MLTSPTTSTLPTLSSLQTPMMSLSGKGLRRKLMLSPVVTASGTMPISPRIATYRATSATAIITGPETVPPGRSSSWPIL